jgi:outer membrane protein TolC
MRDERDDARVERDRARAELEDARAQLPAREEEYRQLQERLSNAHNEVRARLAEVDAAPR